MMYQYPFQQQSQYQNRFDYCQRQEIIKVSGENGAKAYQMPANSSVLLLDETMPIVWLKSTDGAGYPSLTPYTITPYEPEPPVDFKSLEQRIINIEEIINAKSNSSKTKRTTTEE